MKILITNDDGIYAEGILCLANALNKIGNVVIAAPDRQRSATGHAITMHEPLRAKKVKLFEKDFEAWAISGTPADCVKLAVESLMTSKPDIIFSGINDSPNLGTDVLYSGTVSAAIEGAILGYPSVAVSLADFKNLNYEYAAEFCCDIATKIIQNKLPEDTVLNINIPNCPKEEIKGVDITTLGVRKYKNAFTERIDPRGDSYYWLGGEIIKQKSIQGTDTHSIQNKNISITPIHFDLTKFELIDTIKEWKISL